ncbi:MAG: ASKHA domain-containing protein, partial [Desulfobacterales bacterium]|nr:ASKHA domain-containing protein [Desulfobacterales bacterium]
PPAEDPARDLAAHVGTCARQRHNKTLAFRDPDALRGLSRPYARRGPITLVNHLRRGVTAVLEGARTTSLGVALDVGTTTLAAYLCDLPTGRVVASAAAANPQRRFGEDVISRIAHADATPTGTETLQRLVNAEINTLVDGCLATAGAGRTDVDEVTVVGNPTMQQIFAGLHPHSLGFSPYLPVCRAPHDLRAADLGLSLNPGTPVHVFPVISGFVGGDTVGGVLADRPHEREEITLLVDIGTNGELVLGNRQMLWATSCATGPALEGAHIDCGMRAAAGAVHRVQIDPATQRARWEVLGNSAPPQGICGSGIIDAIAGMRLAGLLLDSGRIREGRPGVDTDERGIGRRFVLIPSGETATGQDIFISLGDVRQIQLAKAALSVGIQLLMRRAGIDRIDRMVLTGAFGARFDWRNAVAIGMLPDGDLCGRVEVVENAAGQGAIMALVDRDQRDAALALAERMRFIELAEDPAFALEFPAATAFPPL